jgi:hypothetical protein
MKTESSVARMLWSIACLFLMAFILRSTINPRPAKVDAANPQESLKLVEEAFAFSPQVRLTRLKVRSTERRLREAFDDSDDWMRNLSFEIQSSATKPIVYLEVNINFPETRSSGNLMSYPIKLGIRPDVKTSEDNKPLRLAPGDKLDLSVSEHYDKLESFIRRRLPINQIHKAQVEIGFIIFEDGTAWAGEFLRPDPNKAGRYLPVGSNPAK